MLTIGLIDNHAIMRVGLTIILNDHFRNVNFLKSNNITEFYQLHANKNPDLIIMGNNFKLKQDCLDAVHLLKKQFAASTLIVYDEHILQNMTIPYFKSGVNGYILKESSTTEIITCVETVLDKRQYVCPALLEMLLTHFTKTNNDTPKSQTLTRRESEVAGYLSQGMKTSWIAKTLGRKPSTISTIKYNIFQKMNVENVIQLKRVFQPAHTDFAQVAVV